MHLYFLGRNAIKSTVEQLKAWCMHRFPEKSPSQLYVRNMGG